MLSKKADLQNEILKTTLVSEFKNEFILVYFFQSSQTFKTFKMAKKFCLAKSYNGNPVTIRIVDITDRSYLCFVIRQFAIEYYSKDNLRDNQINM